MTTQSSSPDQVPEDFVGSTDQVRIMTLDPAHFHAALVQKTMLPEVNSTVHVYAPEGPDLDMHLERIESFNSREENPTSWQTKVHTGPNFLKQMLEDQPGNVMIIAGNNGLKTGYIKKTVEGGINVLSDKPMAIDKDRWELLVEAFEAAEENGVLLYDIMTERNEVTSMIQRQFAQNEALFGKLRKGTPEEPAIFQQNTHHLLKTVAGNTLQRPPWYFDIEQQGEGLVDVPTHLVDLAMWAAFPHEAIDYQTDVEMLRAERRPTVLSREQFEEITGMDDFPEYLHNELEGGKLPYYCNGDMFFTLRGHHTKVSVQWDYEAPPEGGDTHFSTLRGTRSDLAIRQSKEQGFKSTLYIEPADREDASGVETVLIEAVDQLQKNYSGTKVKATEDGWKLDIPDEHYLGHEAHFGKVAQDYFGYLAEGALPEWEVPNMITKYYITTQARELALGENAAPQSQERSLRS